VELDDVAHYLWHNNKAEGTTHLSMQQPEWLQEQHSTGHDICMLSTQV
jgi:hypothetical protein